MSSQPIGAPECYRFDNFSRRSRIAVCQTVDIWSFGCVLSETAKWIVHGWHGLDEYRRLRKAETDRITDFKDSGCFHDGEKVLGCVETTHDSLCNTLRHSDIVTRPVLEMIRDTFFRFARPEAQYFWKKSSSILQQAKSQLNSSSPSNHGTVEPRRSQSPEHVSPCPRECHRTRPLPHHISSYPQTRTPSGTSMALAFHGLTLSSDFPQQTRSPEEITPTHSIASPWAPNDNLADQVTPLATSSWHNTTISPSVLDESGNRTGTLDVGRGPNRIRMYTTDHGQIHRPSLANFSPTSPTQVQVTSNRNTRYSFGVLSSQQYNDTIATGNHASSSSEIYSGVGSPHHGYSPGHPPISDFCTENSRVGNLGEGERALADFICEYLQYLGPFTYRPFHR